MPCMLWTVSDSKPIHTPFQLLSKKTAFSMKEGGLDGFRNDNKICPYGPSFWE